ncbi:hypothetical protein ACXXDK_13600 [Deinococcus sp. PESE-38]
MSNTTQHRVHLLTSALALVTLLASCGGPSTPAAPSALSAPLSAAPTAAPKVQVPELRLVTTPGDCCATARCSSSSPAATTRARG